MNRAERNLFCNSFVPAHPPCPRKMGGHYRCSALIDGERCTGQTSRKPPNNQCERCRPYTLRGSNLAAIKAAKATIKKEPGKLGPKIVWWHCEASQLSISHNVLGWSQHRDAKSEDVPVGGSSKLVSSRCRVA